MAHILIPKGTPTVITQQVPLTFQIHTWPKKPSLFLKKPQLGTLRGEKNAMQGMDDYSVFNYVNYRAAFLNAR